MERIKCLAPYPVPIVWRPCYTSDIQKGFAFFNITFEKSWVLQLKRKRAIYQYIVILK